MMNSNGNNVHQPSSSIHPASSAVGTGGAIMRNEMIDGVPIDYPLSSLQSDDGSVSAIPDCVAPIPSQLPMPPYTIHRKQGVESSKALAEVAMLPSTLPISPSITSENNSYSLTPQLMQVITSKKNYTSLSNFESVEIIDNRHELVHYAPHDQLITAKVQAIEVRDIFSVSFDEEGYIIPSATCVKKGSKPSALVHKYFGRGNLTKPFQLCVKRSPKVYGSNISDSRTASEQSTKARGGSNAKHTFAIGWKGLCAHYKPPCICQAEFIAGFEEAEKEVVEMLR